MDTPIKAISFDLWDTLVIDDSDEPKRAEQGLAPKAADRRRLIWEALRRQEPSLSAERVTIAYDVCDAAFHRLWRHQSITWSLEERCRVMFAGLGCSLPEPELVALEARLGRMEIDVPPDLVPGAAEMLDELAGRYQLCIVSDAVVTPGRYLRSLLELHGLAKHFDAMVFSDEVGRSKPHPRPFRAAAAQLGMRPEAMVHVGDRDANDIKGAQAIGMGAVLFTGARDRDAANTTADAICSSHAELPAIIDALADNGSKRLARRPERRG